MVTRVYGQYCGFARALELVGERWALLIIRDLFVGPRRFSDLQRGLPKIPSNILAARLKELEDAGVIVRRTQLRPPGGVVYELTADGRDLEDVVLALGRWGAKRLGEPRPEEIVTPDSMAIALRTIFRPDAAADDTIAFELHVGDIVVNARVDNGTVRVGRGAVASPDLVIETGPAIKALLAGEMTPGQALEIGAVHVRGDRALLDRFVALFRI